MPSSRAGYNRTESGSEETSPPSLTTKLAQVKTLSKLTRRPWIGTVWAGPREMSTSFSVFWATRHSPSLGKDLLVIHITLIGLRVPDNRAVTPGEFRDFYEGFKSDAVAATNKPYFMSFDSIIHREVDGVLYEAADWIIDGYQRGAYFNNAKNGKVVWDMATLAGLGTK